MTTEYVLGVIPARSGSRRVPGKNTRLLGGRPLISYSIAAAQESRSLDRVIVSTDSPQIGAMAQQFGAEVPFLRPAEMATDVAGDGPYLRHAVNWIEVESGVTVTAVAILRPTTPFRTGSMIDDAVNLLTGSGADSVRSVTRAEGVFHPYWSFIDSGQGRLRPFDEKFSTKQFPRSQLLPDVYRLNGIIDVIRRDNLIQSDIYGSDIRLLLVSSLASFDIDTEEDFVICDALVRAGLNPH